NLLRTISTKPDVPEESRVVCATYAEWLANTAINSRQRVVAEIIPPVGVFLVRGFYRAPWLLFLLSDGRVARVEESQLRSVGQNHETVLRLTLPTEEEPNPYLNAAELHGSLFWADSYGLFLLMPGGKLYRRDQEVRGGWTLDKDFRELRGTALAAIE